MAGRQIGSVFPSPPNGGGQGSDLLGVRNNYEPRHLETRRPETTAPPTDFTVGAGFHARHPPLVQKHVPAPGPKCPERPATGERLRPHRPGLHHGLRHPHHDQLRPRRHLHGGNLPQPGRGRLPVGPAAETPVSGGLSGGHDLQHAADRAHGGEHRAPGLPSSAQRPLASRR